MTSVIVPEKRAELIGVLRELADLALQDAEWVNPSVTDGNAGIDYVVHFLFDDTDLAAGERAEIGRIVSDEAEGRAILLVSNLLRLLLEKHGDAPSSVFMGDALWPCVVLSARVALDVLGSSAEEV